MDAPTAGFQKSATPRSDAAPVQPQLYSWGARALYLGPALALSPHRNAVAVLALGLDAPFGVAADPARPEAGYRPCRSVLIPPNTQHHFAGTTGTMAFLYVDPFSRDLPRLEAMARVRTPRAGFDLDAEAMLIDLLAALATRRRDWSDVRSALAPVLSGATERQVDPRLQQALTRLHADFAARIPLAELARVAGLSDSRFRHLFRAAAGVPVRRYRLWIAMGTAMRAIARGTSLTTAALDAGFASSAHFSATFREMFGLAPSQLAKPRLAAQHTPGQS
jgi:AraC-like DNA-binding protein